MAANPIPKEIAKQRLDAVNEALRKGYRPPGVTGGGPAAISIAADALGISRTTFQNSLNVIWRVYKIAPDWTLYAPPKVDYRPAPEPRIEVSNTPEIEPAPSPEHDESGIMAALRRRSMTLGELADKFQTSKGQILDALEGLQRDGANLIQVGEYWSVGKSLEPSFASGTVFEYVSRPDNTFLFGAVGDTHLGSKYERLDVLNDLYDRFADRGVDRVFHTGNWIDGVMPFNVHDLKIHGLEPQLSYLTEHYPKRPGIETYAVTGEDHEGWFARREGIDVGKRAEQTMRDAGRTDWHNLGFMEAHVKLVNANTGKSQILAVVHPGGGSAYALSYSIQKIIEALEGGEKPGAALYGHYHKLWAGNIRNVWVVCTGCTQDQTVFTRNKIKQEVHVGGSLVELEQDPETGALIGMTPKLIRYFAKNYYSNLPLNRWSKSGSVDLPARAP